MNFVLLPRRCAPSHPPLVACSGNLLIIAVSSPDAKQHRKERRPSCQVDGVDIALDAFEALRCGGGDSRKDRLICAARPRVMRVEVPAEDKREQVACGYG